MGSEQQLSFACTHGISGTAMHDTPGLICQLVLILCADPLFRQVQCSVTQVWQSKYTECLLYYVPTACTSFPIIYVFQFETSHNSHNSTELQAQHQDYP